MNNHHKLSIRLQPGGFSFSADGAEPTFVNITPGADYEHRLKDAILALEINNGDDDLECVVETSRFSLSPTVYDDEVAEKMYGLTLRSAENAEKIIHQQTADGQVRVSFGIDSDLHNFLIRTYQYICFVHPLVTMLDDEALRLHATANWMTACVTQSSLFLVAYKDGRLQLANGVETMVTQNRAYHVLNTWTMLELDVLLDTLYIIGEETEVGKLRSEVADFIKVIR